MVMKLQVIKRFALILEEDVLSVESAVEAISAILGPPPIGGEGWLGNPPSGHVTASIFGSSVYIDVYLQNRVDPDTPIDLPFGEATDRKVKDILESNLTVKGYQAFNIATGEGNLRVLYYDTDKCKGLQEVE